MSTDAIVMLRDDHRQIRKLIRAYRAAGDAGPATPAGTRHTAADPAAKADAVGELLHLLSVHTYIEDEVMYPRVRRLLPETGDEVLAFHEEHHVADVLAGELAGMDPGDEAYDAKARVLMDAVERHMAAEEGAWFPRVRGAVGRKELQGIGVRMAEARERAPQAPHRPLLRKLADAVTSAR
ncbi:hemerythrin domain-containing protein [Streptomyces racemochromogenes]|uniref:Hemerythrin domain-containing protein n=1 Tax=Streptomyces racemochromogenes TaxID=67353 RepID=A0ABW7PLQ0_9ACTN